MYYVCPSLANSYIEKLAIYNGQDFLDILYVHAKQLYQGDIRKNLLWSGANIAKEYP